MNSNTNHINPSRTGQADLITASDLQHLPPQVASWLERSGVVGTPRIQRVWISQASEMRTSPDKERWYPAFSEQVFNVTDPAFTWRVKVKMGLVNIFRGKDVFEEGKGKMHIKLFSLIPVVNASGPKIDEGSIQRFLGEIVWFPQGALEPTITWEQVGANAAKALIESHGTRGEGTFYFNDEGDFIRFSAHRYKGNDADAERKEWVITALAHTSFSGIRVPCRLEATWKLDEGDWTWLKMEVKEVRYSVRKQYTPV